MTNVGVVLPYHVRAEDTPQGMKDRIALVGGGIIGSTGSNPGAYTATTWGGYTGTAIVAPNLMGIQQIGFGIQRPSDDDKYGNAIVDSNDISRFSRASKGILDVIGTKQTQPSLGPDGNPDGLARNAGKLRLVAIVNQVGGAATVFCNNPMSIAAVPVSTTATAGVQIEEWSNAAGTGFWAWGVKYDMELQSDGGDLKGVFHHEVMKVDATGVMKKLPQTVGPWDDSSDFADTNAIMLEKSKYATRAKAAEAFRTFFKYADGKKDISTRDQRWVYYVSAVEEKPKKPEDAHQIAKSRFTILEIGFKDKLRVKRELPKSNDKGVIEGTAKDTFDCGF
jgi:hypothetical protein